jgi:hypothetical protein
MMYKEITKCWSVPVYEKAEAALVVNILKYLGSGES